MIGFRSGAGVPGHGVRVKRGAAAMVAAGLVLLAGGTARGAVPPIVISVTPANGPETGGTAVTITGTDFVSGATVTFGGSPATAVSLATATLITCDTPAGTGVVDVVVTNPDAQSATLVGGFAYDPAESIILTSPIGGETWDVAMMHTITWSASGLSTVKIKLSRDGGVLWEDIALSADAMAGGYSWSVTSPASTICLVRISDAADGVPWDESGSLFTIADAGAWVTIRVLKYAEPGTDGYLLQVYVDGVIVETDMAYLDVATDYWDYSYQILDGEVIQAYLWSQGSADYDLELYDGVPTLIDSSLELPPFEPDYVGGENIAGVILAVPETGNTSPVAVDDSAVTAEDMPVIVDVLANDSDADGDSLTVTGVTQGTSGFVVDNGDGTVTYTPNLNFSGADSFTYTISDGNGGNDTATVTVTVVAVSPGSITVTYPDGGEVWLATTTETITWDAEDVTGEVEIEYSTDGGVSYVYIDKVPASLGSYEWTVPYVSSTQCRVRVSEFGGAGVSDESDAYFTIAASGIVVKPRVIEFRGMAGAAGGILLETFTVRYVAQSGAVTVTLDRTNLPEYLTVEATGFVLNAGQKKSIEVTLDAPGLPREESIQGYFKGVIVASAPAAEISSAPVDARVDVDPSRVVTGCAPSAGSVSAGGAVAWFLPLSLLYLLYLLYLLALARRRRFISETPVPSAATSPPAAPRA